MSNGDRLRAAADVLVAASNLADDIVGPTSSSSQGRATAALLQAVADDHPDRCACYDATGPSSNVCLAALALADTILGDEK